MIILFPFGNTMCINANITIGNGMWEKVKHHLELNKIKTQKPYKTGLTCKVVIKWLKN